MRTDPLHTILGATGVIGREISRALPADLRIRQVSRTPERARPDDELHAADLTDARAVDAAVAGSEVAYLCAGLRYDITVWRSQWPRIMDNAIAACVKHGTRLVFFDNVYSYGLVRGAMTEDTPFNPCSKKGEVRAQINTTLLEAMRRGELRALIARAPDFYGPGATNSFTHLMIMERARKKKTPQWLGNARLRHDFIFTPDAGRATAALGQRLDAFGQTWHLPVDPAGITGEQLSHLACRAAGIPERVSSVPRWLLKAMGLFVGELRENDEMMYQFEQPYHFSSEKIARELGLQATAYADGVRACLR